MEAFAPHGDASPDIHSGRIYDGVVTPGYEAWSDYQKFRAAFYSRLQRAVEMSADMPKKMHLYDWLAKRAKPKR
jgi:hypothetical protein